MYAAIFELESWLYLDGLNGIETAAVLYGSAPRFAMIWACFACDRIYGCRLSCFL